MSSSATTAPASSTRRGTGLRTDADGTMVDMAGSGEGERRKTGGGSGVQRPAPSRSDAYYRTPQRTIGGDRKRSRTSPPRGVILRPCHGLADAGTGDGWAVRI